MFSWTMRRKKRLLIIDFDHFPTLKNFKILEVWKENIKKLLLSLIAASFVWEISKGKVKSLQKTLFMFTFEMSL